MCEKWPPSLSRILTKSTPDTYVQLRRSWRLNTTSKWNFFRGLRPAADASVCPKLSILQGSSWVWWVTPIVWAARPLWTRLLGSSRAGNGKCLLRYQNRENALHFTGNRFGQSGWNINATGSSLCIHVLHTVGSGVGKYP